MQNSDRLHSHGDTVLERVLLAIIEAHTTPPNRGQALERLDVAMSALLGPVTERESRLTDAVVFMSGQRGQDALARDMEIVTPLEAEVRTRSRSITELARLAALEIVGCSERDLEDTAEVLCDLYRTTCDRHGTDMDPVEEALRHEAAERICTTLRDFGVSIRMPDLSGF
jgi:hypothetical protein